MHTLYLLFCTAFGEQHQTAEEIFKGDSPTACSSTGNKYLLKHNVKNT